MGFINSLLNNILQNFHYVKADFIGYNLDFNFISSFVLNLIVTLVIFNITYLFGKKIILIIKPKIEVKPYTYLLSIGLGYLAVSLGITILGMLHLLYPQLIFVYLLLILFISLFPFKHLKLTLTEFFVNIKTEIIYFKKDKSIFILVMLFVLLAFVNLINPEYREDQYHVDLPRQYLKFNTNMIPPREQLHVSAAPQAAESYYLIGIFLLSKETARFFHFYFYILTIITLFNFSKLNNKYKFAIYTPLLLVSSPVVIKETSSMYTDFEWIFCILIATLIILDEYKNKYVKYSLSGIFFGGVVASKLWTIIFYPVFSVFIIFVNKLKQKNFKYLFLFIISSLLVYGIWITRSYLLTGNPLYPAFINHLNLDGSREKLNLFQYVGLNYALLNPKYFINVFSPLFFIGIFLLFFDFKNVIKKVFNLNIHKIALLTFFVFLFVQYIFGRYMLGLYIFLIFICAISIDEIKNKFKHLNKILFFISFAVFLYYFINSLLIAPYSIGLSNKNNYLSRILIRDNSSYFDYREKFNKYIKQTDVVGLYNFHGYYYTSFNYIDTQFIIKKRNESINVLKNNKINLIIIRGGDFDYFCNKNFLKDCKKVNVKLISSYNEFPYIYFYSINKND